MQTIWPHDIHFATRTLDDKLTLVVVDNTEPGYSDYVYEKLKAEIEAARADGRKLFLFQHEPITTGNPVDADKEPYWKLSEYNNFYTGILLCNYEGMSEQNRKTYDLICQSADVIKYVFCGHYHSAYYNEIPASYTDENGKHEAVIPQVTFVSNAYSYNCKNEDGTPRRPGCVLRIIVK